MTDILDGQLYLGGYSDVNDEFIKSHQIQTIINVARECDDEPPKQSSIAIVYKFDIDDTFDSVYDYFFDISSLIHKNLKKGHVLIHCMMGISRSSTIILAYMMIHHHMDLLHAYNYVTGKRYILPNPQFMSDLMKLETNLFSTQSFVNQIDRYNIQYIMCRVDLKYRVFYTVECIYYQLNKDYRRVIKEIDSNELDLIDQPIGYKN